MHDRCFAELDDYIEEEVECNECDLVLKEITAPKCPECGEEITFEGGCNICKSCGWSKCD